MRRFKSLLLTAVSVIVATATLGVAAVFAAGAGTPTGAGALSAADRVPDSTRAVTATSSTISPTAEAIAASVAAKNEANVRFLQAIAEARASEKAEAEAEAAAEQAQAEAEKAAAATTVGTTGACGGNLPPCCVMMRESGGNPTAVNPSSGASGKWQFMPSTWANYGGYPTAASAPEYIQDERAAQIWAGGGGAGHWGGGCW